MSFDLDPLGGKIDPPWRPSPVAGAKMPVVKKGGLSATLSESLRHLERLIILHLEWQTDWSAISPSLPKGGPNPDFDPSYLSKIREHPEDIYNSAVLEARAFLESLKSK